MSKVGVLALQGAFIEHVHMIEGLGHTAVEIRKPEQLHDIDGLILPGGESTAIRKLLDAFSLMEPIRERVHNGLPVWGTCAGLILLAKEIESDPVVHLGLMDITAVRNAYGRQLSSFTAIHTFKDIENYPMVFIRAPYISKLSEDVEILATLDDRIVAARQNNILVTAFHPELTDDTRIHDFFIKMLHSK